jgi:hypothetical protein
MIRPVISYALTSLILLSQVGVPLHKHYCKGILESVSVVFSAKCDDHFVPANLPACCKKVFANHCSKPEGKNCCDDEVMVLKQEITSTAPSFLKWIDVALNDEITSIPNPVQVLNSFPVLTEGHTTDSGPPVYILYSSLIFYA